MNPGFSKNNGSAISKKDGLKVCVIIPAYNESISIAKIVKQIKEQGLDVLVIDDGSTDNTGQIAQDNGAIVLRKQNNEGKGAALISGFHYALNQDFDTVITMDADGQHLSCEIPFFLERSVKLNSSFVIGNRMLKRQNMPFIRVITNKFMSWLISKIIKQEIPDSQCGFRLIKCGILRKINLQTSNYDTESEILIRSSRLGFKIESVPIKTIYKKEKSRINPFFDTLRFLRLIVKELFTA
ncbi:MAG: glycosyltransferase family 2 protein [Candidatus Omnitrophota bacterium]